MMEHDYWQQQTDKPLFPNLIWSRPENKLGAGKLLIIGGQAQEFILAAECYGAAEKAGAGTVRVIMPDSTHSVTKFLPNIEYSASNISGSFARMALGDLLNAAEWSDSVLLAGNLGKNSETTLLLEEFIEKYKGLLVINSDAMESFPSGAGNIVKRPETISVFEFSNFQKAAIRLQVKEPVVSDMSNLQLAKTLNDLSAEYDSAIAVIRDKTIWTAYRGQVASTKKNVTTASLSAKMAVWAMQNPRKYFESVTTAAYC